MNKVAALLTIGLALAPSWYPQEPPPANPEMERQEIILLEREAARAIQLHDRTFFRRVYTDDFAGVLSQGQPVNKEQFIDVVQIPTIPYDSFVASDIKVRIYQATAMAFDMRFRVYQETAVATCMWSWRATIKGQQVSSAMRVIHVYINTTRGWKVVAGQATVLPPRIPQPL